MASTLPTVQHFQFTDETFLLRARQDGSLVAAFIRPHRLIVRIFDEATGELLQEIAEEDNPPRLVVVETAADGLVVGPTTGRFNLTLYRQDLQAVTPRRLRWQLLRFNPTVGEAASVAGVFGQGALDYGRRVA
jgi:hypothetical protein